MLGMHGCARRNMAVQSCDLLIVVGARFDDRATGKLADFAPHARVVHLDVDAGEIGKLRHADVASAATSQSVLPALDPRPPQIDAWRARCEARLA